MNTFKEAKHLLRYARRTYNYRKDILSTPDLEELEGEMATLSKARKERDEEKTKQHNKSLTKVLERLEPHNKEAYWREWVEVLLVAIVIAVGVRTYFLQPFKIPTGSMEPTLFGNVGTAIDDDLPNIFQRGLERVFLGRTYFEATSPIDDQVRAIQVVPSFQLGPLQLGRGTRITTVAGRDYDLPVDPQVLENDFGIRPGTVLAGGEPFIRGFQTLGDHVFVDKVSYHFRKPARDDIFVFSTDNIERIEERHTGSDDGQHYIKRLTGLPGERIAIDPPRLLINGEVPDAPGIKRVIAAENGYHGYRYPRDNNERSAGLAFARHLGPQDNVMHLENGKMVYQISEDGYFGMGDNSPNSWDSRNWGEIPRENAVGRGVFVWYPFGANWGFADHSGNGSDRPREDR
jgi:signal peptidase I